MLNYDFSSPVEVEDNMKGLMSYKKFSENVADCWE
jgi:hypothetical protein